MYPLDPSRGQRHVLAILTSIHFFPLAAHRDATTTDVYERYAYNVSRKKIVSALHALYEAGYISKGTHNVFADADNPDGLITTWAITPNGLRVALGVLS